MRNTNRSPASAHAITLIGSALLCTLVAAARLPTLHAADADDKKAEELLGRAQKFLDADDYARAIPLLGALTQKYADQTPFVRRDPDGGLCMKCEWRLVVE